MFERTLENLPFGLEPVDFVALLAAFGAVSVFLLIWYSFIERDPLPARLKALEERRTALRSGLTDTRRRKSLVDKGDIMRRVVDRLKLMSANTVKSTRAKLAPAGFRSRDAMVAYLFAKFCLPLVFGIGSVIWLYLLNPWDLETTTSMALSMLMVGLGYFAPDIYVKNAADKRLHIIRRNLPDGFDLLVICAEAGLSLDAALDRVSKEMAEACPELTEELGLTAVELGFLPDRMMALEALAERVPLPTVRALINTLQQTERYGTPLAQSLRVLSAEMRHERMMKAEEKAARLPAVLTVPMVVFILPPLFVVLIGPAAIRTLDALGGM